MNKSKLVLLALVAVFTTSAFAQKAPHAKKRAKPAAARKAPPKMQCCCMGMMGQMGQMGHMGMMQPRVAEGRMMMPGMHPDMMQMHGQMGQMAPHAAPGMPTAPQMGMMPPMAGGMGMMMGQMDPDSMARMMAASSRVDDAMKALDGATADGKLDAAIAVIRAMNDERKMMHAMMHQMMGGNMRPPMPMRDMAPPAPAGPPPSK